MEMCKNCEYFSRQNWYPDGELQSGGYCGVLLNYLKLENNCLFYVEKLYIQDNFGCKFWSLKKGDIS